LIFSFSFDVWVFLSVFYSFGLCNLGLVVDGDGAIGIPLSVIKRWASFDRVAQVSIPNYESYVLNLEDKIRRLFGLCLVPEKVRESNRNAHVS
jgi:hypothetical protein